MNAVVDRSDEGGDPACWAEQFEDELYGEPPVDRWTCPDCGRQFGRTRQGHECAPALSLEEYFSTGPERERPIFEAVHAHLASLGDVHVEPVSVGIFFKVRSTFAQLRPMTKWVALSFASPMRIEHERISRKPIEGSGRWHHVVNVRDADEIDDLVKGWLTQAYDLETGGRSTPG